MEKITIYTAATCGYCKTLKQELEKNNIELSMYDFVIGSTIVLEMAGGYKHTDVNELRKGLDWFRKTNPKAYMVLLD